MQLENMSNDELIALVKRQEQELAAARADSVAIPLVEFKAVQPVQQPAPVAGQEPFGIYVERDDGTTEFQRTGKAFLGTALGYKAWTLYAATVPAASVQPGPDNLFDLIREWAHLPEGERGQAARNIIGCVNRSYSAGVADGKVLGALAATQPDSGRDAALVEDTALTVEWLISNGHMDWHGGMADESGNDEEFSSDAHEKVTIRELVVAALAAHPAASVAQGEGQQDRIDAERYRWLRDQGHGNSSMYTAWIATGSLKDGVTWVGTLNKEIPVVIDAMIDTMRALNKKGGAA